MLHQRLNDGRVIAVMHQPMPHGGSVATYEDVTQTVHAEEALRDYAARLERSNRELQDFASIASHDLQEPLRKIEAFGDRLVARCGAELSDAGRVYVDRMQDAAGRMRLLINDLLTYSRVTTTARPFARGRSRPDRRRGDVGPPGRDRAGRRPDRAGRSAGHPGRRHADAPAAAEPAQQRAEVPLRGTARRRCVSAARLYTPERPEHRAAAPPLCELTVADNGIGFKQDYAERIFGIFQRLHGRSEYPGTGIGLATCRKILERHGGTIAASGRPGEGAAFVFTLPVSQSDEPADVMRYSTPITILVADDDADDRLHDPGGVRGEPGGQSGRFRRRWRGAAAVSAARRRVQPAGRRSPTRA